MNEQTNERPEAKRKSPCTDFTTKTIAGIGCEIFHCYRLPLTGYRLFLCFVGFVFVSSFFYLIKTMNLQRQQQTSSLPQSQPQNAMEHFLAFRSAIKWSEKFILGLVAFQVVIFFLCLHFSRKDRGLAPRVTLLVIIFIVVRSAEWLNAQGEEHWELFATQDYFDKRGIFVGIMLSGPLLLDSLMMLLFFMREASSLLVQVKRTEIQRKKQKNDGKATGGKKKITGKRAKTKKQD
jgi:hypothetical protein